ncbi:MAG TPA: hypothetical protein VFY21_10670 [Xanthobacteraceae bacterium]|nr:hypothetical protein [Xanthobacteraceae bacterium]
MRFLWIVMTATLIGGSALAQTKHVPWLGKNLDQYSAEKIDPRYAPHPSGGDTRVFSAKYAASAARGESWRIISDCASACTIGFGHYAKTRICVGGWVKLGFHLGENEPATAQMWNAYPSEIKALINARGGLRREWLWIPAAEFHKLGFPAC